MTKKTRKQKILFKKQQNVESDALLESNAKKLMSTDPTDDQTNLGTFSEQVISIGGTNKACDDPAKNDNKGEFSYIKYVKMTYMMLEIIFK